MSSLLLIKPHEDFSHLAFEFFNVGARFRQAAPMSVEAFVFVQRPRRYSPHDGPLSDNLARQDASLRAYDCAATHARMVAHPDLAADDGVVFYHGRAGDARLRGNHDAFAYQDVVRYLHEVINLRKAAYPCFTKRATVNATARAYLHIIANQDCSYLRKFVATILRVRHKAEAVRADDDARVKKTAAADRNIIVERDLRMKNAIRSD
jgi:hypothetical protein